MRETLTKSEQIACLLEMLRTGAESDIPGSSTTLYGRHCALLLDLLNANGLEPEAAKPEVVEFTGAELLAALEEIVVDLYQALGDKERNDKYGTFEIVDILKFVLAQALRDFHISTTKEPALGYVPGYMAEVKKRHKEWDMRLWAACMEAELTRAYGGRVPGDDDFPF